MSSKAIVLDSSVWIEILGEGPLFKQCTKELKTATTVFVPTLVFFEVYRKITTSTTEDRALSGIALLSQYTVVELTKSIALTAADLSMQYKLGMADSMVLAHAQYEGAILITLDNDFHHIPHAKVLRKP